MTKKVKAAVAAAAVATVAIIFAVGYYRTFYADNLIPSETFVIKVRHDWTYSRLEEEIFSSGMLVERKSFVRAARKMNLEEDFKSGNYLFSSPMNNKQIVRTLAKGWQKPVRISFNGYIRDLARFAGMLGEKLEADSARFAAVLLDRSTMERYGFNESNFIGMFIPNTYELWWTVTPEDFVARMNKEYNTFWNDTRKAKAASIGLSQQEVTTLASIVIEESKYEPELPDIAGVYINRLKRGMPLQADPTVKFAINDTSVKRILNRHLTVDSPYNTYTHTGLPPGPITMPTISAIDAVLNYRHHNYLYFCAKETFDGQHNFAATLSQHNANARKYHNALKGK